MHANPEVQDHYVSELQDHFTSWSVIMNIIKLLFIKVVITKMVEQVM